jgi:dTDP-4-dehydrorhamnose reductase
MTAVIATPRPGLQTGSDEPRVRTLILGVRGMLGQDMAAVFAASGHPVVGLDLPDLDVRDLAQVRKAVADTRAERVLHLAALTDVDRCEREPDAAYLTNTLGTHNVAEVCRAAGVELVYISTLAVFNGDKPGAYDEFDTPDPRSIYSRSKYQGELLVRQLAPRHFIVRAGWLFGGGPEDKKFVARIVALARERSELQVVDDKFGSPTYTRDFSEGLLRLVTLVPHGTYHLVNTGAPASRYSVAQHILEYAGLQHCRLLPVGSDHFPLPAPRPNMEAGRNYALELRGHDLMRPWPEALAEYVTTVLHA